MTGAGPFRATLVALIAAVFGWLVGSVFPLIGPGFAATVSLVAALGAEVAHRLADRGIASPNLRIAELGAAFVIAKLVHLAYLGPAIGDELSAFPAGLADPETTLGFMLMWLVRSASYKAIRDMGLVGSPGDETVGTAYDRLARRFRLLLGLCLVLAAFGLAGWRQITDLTRPPLEGLVWPVAVLLVLGLATLGGFRRIEDAGRWRRAGSVVDDRVWLRWGSGVITITVVVAAVGLWFRAGVDQWSTAPRLALAGLAAVGRALVRALGLGDSDPLEGREVPPATDLGADASTDGGIFDFLGGEEALSQASGWEVAVIALAWVGASVALITFLVAVLRSRKWIRSAFQIGPAEGFRAILSEFLRMLGEIGRLLWQMLTFWRPRPPPGSGRTDDGEDATLEPGRRHWSPSDLQRSRVAAAYHRFLVAAAAILPRHRSETPDEYRRAVGDQIPFGSDKTGRLTDLFVEARYSSHRLSDSDIDDAEQISEELEHMIRHGTEGDT